MFVRNAIQLTGAVALGLCGFLMAGNVHAADAPKKPSELVYVKKETREETRRATLVANSAGSFADDWYLIGPFDNKGLKTVYPPETEINLDATYEGKGEPAVWRKFSFPAGQVHNLKKFKSADKNICYLYQQIESPKDASLRCSLGSDDGVQVFLNGQKVFENDSNRPANPDDDFVTLKLKKGKNDLLLKISNGTGDWAFYFAASVPQRLALELETRLNKDFPQAGEAQYYEIRTLPLPENELIEVGGMAFRPDGKLYVATRRGDVWLVSNPLSDDPDEITFKPFARGLHEVLGLRLVNGTDLYLAQRPEVSLIRDTNGDDEADEFITVTDKYGCSGDYHEYNYGPARDADGNLYITTNVGFGGGHQAKVPYRGFCLKIAPNGQVTPWAYGLRSPNGLNFSPEGRLFYSDNQGEWVGSCKLHEIRQNEFYGHMASVRWWEGKKDGDRPEMVQPVIWFPYSMSKSTSEMAWDTTGGKFGPFTGQLIVGDLTNSLLMRVALEDVKGRAQGAVFQFRTGFQCGVNRIAFAPDGSLFVGETNRGWGSVGGQPHGIQRVVYTGVKPFEIHSMKVTPTGWDLHFTEPVNKELAAKKETYFMDSYTYHHWATYGSPEIERKPSEITDIQVSDDGLKVSLSVPDRGLKRVYHLEVKGLQNAEKTPLLHKDAYYTLNEVP